MTNNLDQVLNELAADTPRDKKAAPPPSEEATGDFAFAETLSELFRNRYRWAPHRKTWMRYSGGVWRPVDGEAVATAAAQELRAKYGKQSAECRDTNELERLGKLLRATCSYNRIQGGLAFLKGWDNFLTPVEQWDANFWTLNVANGVVDLREGTLTPHDPAQLHTMQAPVEFNPQAQAPKWEGHLRYFLPDENVRRQIQRDMGVALVGEVLEESLSIWYGTGGNGKTTTSEIFMRVLGDYAQRAAPDLLIEKRHKEHPTEVADLAGSRWVVSVESGDGRRLAESFMKELTGGETKKARFMNCNFFEFPQTFSVVLLTNHRPNIAGADEGVWRRIRLIPWLVAIEQTQKRSQSEVITDLMEEAPGILAWCLHGLEDRLCDPTWISPEVQAATAEYRAESDWLNAFLNDCVENGTDYRVGVTELYHAYCRWCEQEGREPVKQQTFTKRMKDLGYANKQEYTGYQDGKRVKQRRWCGLRLALTPTVPNPSG